MPGRGRARGRGRGRDGAHVEPLVGVEPGEPDPLPLVECGAGPDLAHFLHGEGYAGGGSDEGGDVDDDDNASASPSDDIDAEPEPDAETEHGSKESEQSCQEGIKSRSCASTPNSSSSSDCSGSDSDSSKASDSEDGSVDHDQEYEEGPAGELVPVVSCALDRGNHGIIRYKLRDSSFCAHCPFHEGCRVTRTTHPRKRRDGGVVMGSSQGRPLGFLAAWLIMLVVSGAHRRLLFIRVVYSCRRPSLWAAEGTPGPLGGLQRAARGRGRRPRLWGAEARTWELRGGGRGPPAEAVEGSLYERLLDAAPGIGWGTAECGTRGRQKAASCGRLKVAPGTWGSGALGAAGAQGRQWAARGSGRRPILCAAEARWSG